MGSGSFDEDDLKVSLRELRNAISSLNEKIELLISAAINDHKNECWRCNEFVKRDQLRGYFDEFTTLKRRSLIDMAEMVKAVLYIAATIGVVGLM